ncbi:cryptochrome/photolyase family protein [Phaeobacter inhibens]|uniref:cryptochrome/photolyase family protein n=1 Tax=Phaeobacter inhibens TaxID=221822 RepID=UPI000C9C8AEA|nr:deoxyribodipyrimidine photo-lyase [Phaeobacter inhibens]AUQ62416.1 deoxyribodipyrimidine photo-lyase PhrB [Phaeobacter inhibens]AUQ82319.1 deoxyribodipyrimidine photo-lyase PhrB [Phaeobacter inhibens]AUQ90080.1 deoxyribodipyrimidine photo-lyase PhrB [Phaeobacter inhibens]MDO6755149.1 deoxyribodipyrimidine photo-lyase [Phaeobacter inhibens]
MTDEKPSNAPIIWWVRRDLRLADNPALDAAVAAGVPVIPVFIFDTLDEDLGAAPRFRLGLGLAHLAKELERRGARLILRRGPAQEVLTQLITETSAGAVHWTRAYDPQAIARDTGIKEQLKGQGIAAKSFGGHLLFEPWTVETKTGGMYRVYSPYWKSVRDRDVDGLIAAPSRIPAPAHWPTSDDLDSWQMAAAMRRGADVVAQYCRVGEDAAQERLAEFLDTRVADYKQDRDFPAVDATSGLSENLAWGEISPRRMWHHGLEARRAGKSGAEHFLKEIVWREFAYHLMFHTPHILTRNWRPEWESFRWSEQDDDRVDAWRRGQTGYNFVDAAMRELYVTGKMHNRARMIVASFLTKHMLTHWRIGQQWFEECLVDWDPASNAMGWQWVAGSGPDASPFFRIFNPDGQLEKFDPKGRYQSAWIAEVQASPPQTALDFYRATPLSWGLSPQDRRASPFVDLKEGRARALEAYGQRELPDD